MRASSTSATHSIILFAQLVSPLRLLRLSPEVGALAPPTASGPRLPSRGPSASQSTMRVRRTLQTSITTSSAPLSSRPKPFQRWPAWLAIRAERTASALRRPSIAPPASQQIQQEMCTWQITTTTLFALLPLPVKLSQPWPVAPPPATLTASELWRDSIVLTIWLWINSAPFMWQTKVTTSSAQ